VYDDASAHWDHRGRMSVTPAPRPEGGTTDPGLIYIAVPRAYVSHIAQLIDELDRQHRPPPAPPRRPKPPKHCVVRDWPASELQRLSQGKTRTHQTMILVLDLPAQPCRPARDRADRRLNRRRFDHQECVYQPRNPGSRHSPRRLRIGPARARCRQASARPPLGSRHPLASISPPTGGRHARVGITVAAGPAARRRPGARRPHPTAR
jgi:hypothetical protein